MRIAGNLICYRIKNIDGKLQDVCGKCLTPNDCRNMTIGNLFTTEDIDDPMETIICDRCFGKV